MNSSLDQYCDLVANVAVTNASNLSSVLVKLLEGELPTKTYDVLPTFAFMNFTFAQGAWSSLTKKRLRRDLLAGLKDAIIIRLAQTFPGDASDKAAQAVGLGDQFNDYLRAYVANANRIGESNSQLATMFALERIQRQLGLSDDVMDRIVPKLVPEQGLSKTVDDVAVEVVKSWSERGTGLFKRLFG